MELVLHQNLETLPEPIAVNHFTTQGLLNSNYKSVVKQNFSKSTRKSIFGKPYSCNFKIICICYGLSSFILEILF